MYVTLVYSVILYIYIYKSSDRSFVWSQRTKLAARHYRELRFCVCIVCITTCVRMAFTDDDASCVASFWAVMLILRGPALHLHGRKAGMVHFREEKKSFSSDKIEEEEIRYDDELTWGGRSTSHSVYWYTCVCVCVCVCMQILRVGAWGKSFPAASVLFYWLASGAVLACASFRDSCFRSRSRRAAWLFIRLDCCRKVLDTRTCSWARATSALQSGMVNPRTRLL